MCVKSRKVLARSLEAFQNGKGRTGIRSLNREHLKQRVRKKIKARAEDSNNFSVVF